MGIDVRDPDQTVGTLSGGERQAMAIADVEKDDAAEIADAMNPAEQQNRLASVIGNPDNRQFQCLEFLYRIAASGIHGDSNQTRIGFDNCVGVNRHQL